MKSFCTTENLYISSKIEQTQRQAQELWMASLPQSSSSVFFLNL